MSKGEKVVILALYVDDNLILSNSTELLRNEKEKLCKKFDMEDLGEVTYLLGMAIQRDRQNGILKIDQKLNIHNILERFGMNNCKPVATPLETGKKFMKTPDDEDPVDTQRYQAIIGSLVYLSISTRPDIAEAEGKQSQHMARPSKEQLDRGKTHIMIS